MRESEDLKRMKDKVAEESKDDDAQDMPGKARERVQAVGTKSFVKRSDGRWVDTAYDGKAETKKIEAYSDAWMTLLATSDELARILALGERVVFVHKGTVYEVVPAAEAPAR
jgi:hypothetical protein